jgi:hypothetical protein
MNFFRSEEHVKNWTQFKADSEKGIVQVPDLLKAFSGRFFRRRLDPDWFSKSGEYLGDVMAAFIELGKKDPFWRPPKQ